MRIFISYRRRDSLRLAGEVRRRLAEVFDGVFLDTMDIPLGIGFQRWLEAEIHHSDLILVLIGPAWADDEGLRRLEDPHDYVRLEVRIALLRAENDQVSVIPVTFGGVRLRDLRLPRELEDLRKLNGIELSDDDPVSELVRRVEARAAAVEGGAEPLPPPRYLRFDVDLDQRELLYGGPIGYTLPDDAVLRLWPDDRGWDVAIECPSDPGRSRRRGSLGTAPLVDEDAFGAAGGLLEWFDVSLSQIRRWLPNPAFRKGGLFGFGATRDEPEGRFVELSGHGVPFASLRRMLLEFDRGPARYTLGDAEGPPSDGSPVAPQLKIFGRLAAERRFGTYVASLTQDLGGVAGPTGDLLWLPAVPGTALRFLDARAPIVVDGRTVQLFDVGLVGHVGRDEQGFHIVYVG